MMDRVTRNHPPGVAAASLMALWLAFTPIPGAAQSGYTLPWSTVDGGGTTLSERGPPQLYRVSGTAGQPDAGVLIGGVYRLTGGFWIGDARAITGVEPELEAPVSFRALRPRPNPAPGRVTFGLELPSEREVTISIFDLSGRLVRSLPLGRLAAGRHTTTWDGKTASGSRAAAGIYFTRIRAGEFVARGRVVLLDES